MIILLIGLLPLLCTVSLLVWYIRRPICSPLQVDGADTWIWGAHQDDCVILGGEFALETLQKGGQVHIVYLTCGDKDPNSKRARVRRTEAIHAWASAGLEEGDLTFLDLPESSLEELTRIDDHSLKTTRAAITRLLAQVPVDSVVIVPAAGESHVDHRLVRALVLDAAREQRRSLRILEAPEYNRYFAIRYSPSRTARFLVESLPGGGRILSLRALRNLAPSFPNGAGTLMLPPDDERLQRKRELLMRFESEDGDFLARTFGFRDKFRVVDLQRASDQDLAGFVRLNNAQFSYGVLAAWSTLALALGTLAFLITQRAVTRLVVAGTTLWLCVAFFVSLSLVWVLLQRRPEKRGLVLAGALGVVLGSFW